MRTLVPLLLLGLGALGFVAPSAGPAEWTFILGGDTDGYLSPCGCTKPMSGGIRRRADAVRALRVKDRTVILENGGFVIGAGRQDELKAEALAEMARSIDATAVHFGPAEARLGRGSLLTLATLTDQRLVSSHAHQTQTEIQPYITEGPFLIGAVATSPGALAGVLDRPPKSVRDAVKSLVDEAKAGGLEPVLMLQGDLAAAEALAKEFPELRLIQYRSIGDPPAAPTFVGKTVLATPGEKNKHVVRLRYRDGGWSGYLRVRLSPDFKDDGEVSRFYRTYLRRVDEEDLLSKVPKPSMERFIGSDACGACHSEAHDVLRSTTHFKALKTLEDDGHGKDPDCVSCHVTGFESRNGFRSRKETPDLAHVGCESCHGAGAAHAADPTRIRLPSAAESCGKCHTGDTSPGFEFEEYWRKIRHK